MVTLRQSTSLDGRVAQVYPFEEWEQIKQKLAGLSDFNPMKKKFLNRVRRYGRPVKMDGQGMLSMPQLLREAARIKGEVAVLGNLTYLEVRKLETFRKVLRYPPTRRAYSEFGRVPRMRSRLRRR